MRYVLTDVFTDRAFGGNQLAVFPEAEGLETAQMQALARELNLSESTFVTPGSAPGHFKVRIFTPLAELPFAGHPTVGTSVVVAELGRTEGRSDIVLEEGVGPIPVVLHPGGARFALSGAAEMRKVPLMPVAIADMLGLDRACLVGEPWQAGYGVPYLIVQVATRADVAQSRLHPDRLAGFAEALWANRAVYVFAETGRDGAMLHLHARMYAPGLGVAEDSATGSAAAALAGSLDTDATLLSIGQGIEMGRPSRIEASIARTAGQVTGITIGGSAVVVGEGRFTRLP